MSVDYNSALIYGWDCSRIQEDWPYEATEQMEELGFDVYVEKYEEAELDFEAEFCHNVVIRW